jgi:large subunit ribosomal protein L17
MRHLRTINHLGRKSADRKSLMSNMASSLILHKRITTSVAKARALRSYVEPLLTKSKEDSTNSRRVVFSYLENKSALSELFREVAPKIASRPGGYTRILKLGNRLGDAAEMCLIETGEAAKSKTARRRRAPKKKTAEDVAAPAATEKAARKKAPEADNETKE